MPPITPNLPGQDVLKPLASRYVDVDSLSWEPSGYPGVTMKILMEDKETGMMTGLFKFEPGARLPYHEHVELEQSYLIEGSVEDHEGNLTAGNYVWRPGGNRHHVYSPNGALALSIFLKPNVFLDKDEDQAAE